MKHTTEDLILASAVVQRVIQLRKEAMRGMTEEQKTAFELQPDTPLILEALRELDIVAAVIAEARPQSPTQQP